MGKILSAIVIALVSYIAWNWDDIADAYRQAEAASADRAKYNAEPHVIRETKDGCKVYKFMDGGYWRYFTRCADRTTTEYQVPSGKTSRPGSITTENTR